MKISEVIEYLSEIKRVYGDLSVVNGRPDLRLCACYRQRHPRERGPYEVLIEPEI